MHKLISSLTHRPVCLNLNYIEKALVLFIHTRIVLNNVFLKRSFAVLPPCTQTTWCSLYSLPVNYQLFTPCILAPEKRPYQAVFLETPRCTLSEEVALAVMQLSNLFPVINTCMLTAFQKDD